MMSARSSPHLSFVFTAALLGWGLLPRTLTGRVGEAMRDSGPALADVEKRERGYYETLIDAGRRIDQIGPPANPARPHSHAQADAPFDAGELALTVSDVREFVLKPNLCATHKGQPWNTNEFGMRDQPYALDKPPGTLRIALIGDSIGSGWGVDGESGFEPLLERSLDANSRRSNGPAVEVWNFSVPGHAPGQRWEDFRQIGWSSQPDLLIYEATPADLGWDERRLRALLARDLGWDVPQYRATLESLGLPRHATAEVYKRLLRPHRNELLAGVYSEIARDCRRHGVPALWVLIPRVGRPTSSGERQLVVAMAQAAGFSAVLDLSGLFDDAGAVNLAISADDFHPNTVGHARVAKSLDQFIKAHPALLPMEERNRVTVGGAR
jgi:hypothetical protein